MDVKECDRCGRRFRVLEGEHVVPESEVVNVAPGKPSPAKPPKGLQHMNKATLAVAARDGEELRYSLCDVDLCAKCMMEFAPITTLFMTEKSRVGGGDPK